MLYPDSLPKDWLLKLEMVGIPMAISPLHDKDKSNHADLKKPHYHVIYIAKNPVTADSVRHKIKNVLGDKSIAIVQIIRTSVENTYLYLTHESKDAIAENKHVYDKSDIKLVNNFDIDRYITIDVEEKEYILNTICNLIDAHDLANMRDLKRYIESYGQKHGLTMNIVNAVVRSYTSIVRLYFDAVYQDLEKQKRAVIDPKTGEIKYR